MKYKTIGTIFMVSLVCGFAHAQTISKNLNLSDFVSYQTLYDGQSVTPSGQETITDIASWKDTGSGTEYALVCLIQAGSGSGIAVVDEAIKIKIFWAD